MNNPVLNRFSTALPLSQSPDRVPDEHLLLVHALGEHCSDPCAYIYGVCRSAALVPADCDSWFPEADIRFSVLPVAGEPKKVVYLWFRHEMLDEWSGDSSDYILVGLYAHKRLAVSAFNDEIIHRGYDSEQTDEALACFREGQQFWEYALPEERDGHSVVLRDMLVPVKVDSLRWQNVQPISLID